MDAANVASAMASATQRPALMPRSPSNSTSTPPAIGSQVRNERIGNSSMFALVVRSGASHEPAEHEGESDDHPERIGIEEAGLNAANDAGRPADEARRPADEGAIDDGLVA